FKFIKMFAERAVHKEYLALVEGVPHLKSGSIKQPIGRDMKVRVKMAVTDKGRPAHTDWVLEKAFESTSLLRCYLHTGRTHQIRVHLASIHYPILGDITYGYRYKKGHGIEVSRVMLHAERISFLHPITGEPILIVAPLPEDFKDYINFMKKE
ncbi:MAG: RluA family pseudouridine synthase, partial [Verrucomicrobia bacterium]